MIAIRCLLCGKKEAPTELYPATVADADLTPGVDTLRRLSPHSHNRIVRCTRCGLVYASPVLPAKTVETLYPDAAETDDAVRTYDAATSVRLIERYRFYLPAHPQVLEIGCGSGFFLTALKQRYGWTKLYGVEPQTAAAGNAPAWLRRSIITDRFRPGQFPEASMDLVCCFRTLDRLTDPKGMLVESMRILRPGGLLILVTPDADALSVRLLGGRSPLFDLRHTYLFSRRTLGQLAATAGYIQVTGGRLVTTYPLGHWVRTSGLPRAVTAAAEGMMKVVGVTGKPASFAGRDLFMVFRKPIALIRPPGGRRHRRIS
jgi:SAM-dependent methyltransferase